MITIIVRYGEIGTKSGKTRSRFISRLINNIKIGLSAEGVKIDRIDNLWSRIVVHAERGAIEVLPRIFGISSISPAFEASNDLEDIYERCVENVPKGIRTFRVSCQRLWKGFSLTSVEVNKELGKLISERLGLKVNLESPEVDIGVEILKDRSYVFFEKIPGPGGLPIGVEGKLLGVVRGMDEALNVLLGMKRGAEVAVFSSSERLLKKISRYSYGNSLPLNFSEDPLSESFEGVEGVLAVPRSFEELKSLREGGSLPVYDLVSYLPKEVKGKLIRKFSLI